MHVTDTGRVCLTTDDVIAMAAKGYMVSMHTPYYANGITVYLPDGYSIGFHNWLDNADVYVGDTQVKIKDDAHLAAVIALMDSVLAVKAAAK